MDENPYRAPQQEIIKSRRGTRRSRRRWTPASVGFLVLAMLATAGTLGEILAWYAQRGIVDVTVPISLIVSSAFAAACFLMAIWLQS